MEETVLVPVQKVVIICVEPLRVQYIVIMHHVQEYADQRVLGHADLDVQELAWQELVRVEERAQLGLARMGVE